MTTYNIDNNTNQKWPKNGLMVKSGDNKECWQLELLETTWEWMSNKRVWQLRRFMIIIDKWLEMTLERKSVKRGWHSNNRNYQKLYEDWWMMKNVC